MLTLDYSLNKFKVPGISAYTPPFGTKKEEGVGLTTTEITKNEMAPFMKQRSICGVAVPDNDPPLGAISEDARATQIEFDATMVVSSGIQLSITPPTYEGQKLTVIGSFNAESPPSEILMESGGGPQDRIPIAGCEVILFHAIGGRWYRLVVGGEPQEKVVLQRTPSERYLFPYSNSSYGINVLSGVGIRYWDPFKNEYKWYFETPNAGEDWKTRDLRMLLDEGSVYQGGKDYFLYLVPREGDYIQFVTSLNSTFPSTVTQAKDATLIGGFHTMCVNAGVIQNMKYWHPLSGSTAGAILPNSVWDLHHRPKCHEFGVYGMVYIPGANIWSSIYLMSAWGTFPSGSTKDVWPPKLGGLVSRNLVKPASGGSASIWSGSKFAQFLGQQGMRLPTYDEFVALSVGSPQGETLQNTQGDITGGNIAASGQRIVSYYGVEDATGFYWQWGQEIQAEDVKIATYENAYTDIDIDVAGQQSSPVKRMAFGGSWTKDSLISGSRAIFFGNSTMEAPSAAGCRGISESKN